MSDLLSYIYHEKQEPGSMMCLQHSINNLLQSELFSPASLADIARELDALESAQLDPGTRLRGETSSQNVDESGFFSVQVAEKALEVLGLRVVRWGNQELAHLHNKPEQFEAFLLNHQMHWFSIRRFAPNRFYNLDSCTPQPTWVSEMSLGLHLREFELQGYSIFAIIPSSESHLDALPPCDASNIASSLGAPSGGGNGASSFASGSGSSNNNNNNNSHIRFNGAGHSLGGAASSSSSSNPFSSGLNPTLNRTLSKGKRPASDEDDEDDDIIIDDSRVTSAGSSSVEEESEQRRRRRKMNNDSGGSQAQNGNDTNPGGGAGGGMEMSEEDMMAKAIEESLRVSRINPGEQSASEAGDSSGATSARPRSRAAEAEEEEFQRALQASLAAAASSEGGGGGDGMDEEEEDAPTMEELRARRLARFA